MDSRSARQGKTGKVDLKGCSEVRRTRRWPAGSSSTVPALMHEPGRTSLLPNPPASTVLAVRPQLRSAFWRDSPVWLLCVLGSGLEEGK